MIVVCTGDQTVARFGVTHKTLAAPSLGAEHLQA